jgi:hypothetical protein
VAERGGGGLRKKKRMKVIESYEDRAKLQNERMLAKVALAKRGKERESERMAEARCIVVMLPWEPLEMLLRQHLPRI